jgi:hypothetical protein
MSFGGTTRALCAALAIASLGACAASDDGAARSQVAGDRTRTALAPLAAKPRLDPILRFEKDPRQLIGLDGSQVSVLLGRPTLKRRDPPAEIWQYAGRDCVLMLFLYDQPKGGKTQVDHVELRPRSNEARAVDACFVGLLKANASTLGES